MKHFIAHSHSNMGRYFLSLSLLVFLFSFAGCQDEDERGIKNPGILSLALESDTAFHAIPTKATVLDELAAFTNPNEYAVEILQGEEVVLSYDRYADMPGEIELSAGSYTMRAYKGTDKPGAFNNPYFEGKTNFVIEKGMRTPIYDTATLANTRVFVNYTEDFLDAYEEYRVRMNTEHMGNDTLSFKEGETRGAYFKSDADGTQLALMLWLVKREDTIINYYKPTPITIYPRENVGLLFKTDDGALTGIGLEVTVNRGFEGDTILNMTIPEYAWGDAKEPEFGIDNFEDIINETYANLQTAEKYNLVWLDYNVPAYIGKCLLTVSTDQEGSTPQLYELTTDEGLQAASLLGLELRDLANNPLTLNLKQTKQGRIYFGNVLKSLPAKNTNITYTYQVQITDALPTNPNLIEASMVVSPKPAGESKFVATNVRNYEVTHNTPLIAEPILIEYVQDAGIKTSTLTIYRNNSLYGEYEVVSGTLPAGISYNNNVLTFAKDFADYLPKASGQTEVYKFELTAVDNLGASFENPVTFTMTMEPVSYEIVIPTQHIWGWKAKVEIVTSGISNTSDVEVYLSGTHYPLSWSGTLGATWLENLESGKSYTVEVKYKDEIQVKEFITESEQQLEYADMETWYLGQTTCTYGSSLSSSSLQIPFPYLNSSGNDGAWSTNNAASAGEAYTNTSFFGTNINTIPAGCFPTVVYEDRGTDDGLAAVIRSIDASAKNSKTRGELKYNNLNFSSRPSGISFEYQYTSYNSENFEVSVIVRDENRNVIGTGTRPASAGANADYQQCNVVINYSVVDKKAAEIEILFASAGSSFSTPSSTATVSAPNPANGTGPVSYPAKYNSFAGVKQGSVLKIDNVKLNYTGE